jgi:hypothetical protein
MSQPARESMDDIVEAAFKEALKALELKYDAANVQRHAAMDQYHAANGLMYAMRRKIGALRELLDLDVPYKQWQNEDEENVELGIPTPAEDGDSGTRLSDVPEL